MTHALQRDAVEEMVREVGGGRSVMRVTPTGIQSGLPTEPRGNDPRGPGGQCLPAAGAPGAPQPVARSKPSSFQPSTPPIIFFTGRPSRARRMAALSAPLQCGPAQYTTKSVASG